MDSVSAVGSFANYGKSVSREDVKLSRLRTAQAIPCVTNGVTTFDRVNVTEMLTSVGC